MTEVEGLLIKYKSRGLLIDTNILLLVIIGLCDRKLIGSFKRVIQYADKDYEVVTQLANNFNFLVTTPYILTETSNLAFQLPNCYHDNLSAVMQKLLHKSVERYIPSVEIVEDRSFTKYGITDAGISVISQGNYLVLTDDFKLAGFLKKKTQDVINFNHIRQHYLLS